MKSGGWWRWLSVLPWIALLAAASFVLYHWFYPLQHYYYDDEWFVLPERVWFNSSWEWLSHLLLFNQTRYTYAGDQILVRPGLFLWMWIQDELFRANREGQQLFLAGVAIGAFTIFFFALRKECGKWLAFAAALFAFSCLPGVDFYNWSHLSGYVLALAFYTLAIHLQFTGQPTVRRALVTGILFFLAETCHELVACSMVILVAIELYRARPVMRRVNLLRLLPMVAALFAYTVLVVAVWAIHPPKLISGTATQSVPFSLENISAILKIMAGVFLQVLNNLVPFLTADPEINIARWILGGLLILALAVRQCIRPTEGRQKLVAVLIPILILFVGLALGRVSMQGVVKIHYFPLFQFFAVLAIFLMWPGGKWGSRLAPVLAIVLAGSSVYNAQLVRESRPQREEWVGAAVNAARGISSYLETHPDRCFAGIFDPNLRTRINAAMNISFSSENCGLRKGKPVTFKLNKEGNVAEFETKTAEPSVRLMDRLSLPAASGELDGYLNRAPLNLFERKRTPVTRGLELRYLYEPITTHSLQARFYSLDEYPILYNAGLAISSDRGPVFFLLQNNMLRLLTIDSAGKVTEFAYTQLPRMNHEFWFTISDNNEFCDIYYDEFLVMQIPSCLQGNLKVGTFTFANGTAPETLVDLIVSPY